MTRGATIFIVAALLSASACNGDRAKLEIRSIPLAVASGERSVSFRVAEARGEFALGNVALALESYRKAAREEPDNVDALVGIAACYDRMGRFDLSRRYYEAALAVTPRDPALLAAFAASLDLQHLAAEAASVRGEINQRQEAAIQSASHPSATAALQPILPTSVANAVAAAISATNWSVGASPARAPRPGPRLERLSLGEVALITVPGPQWREQRAEPVAPRLPTGAAAIRQAAAERSGLRLFNAARIDKLAARTRAYLSGRGWSVASVGDQLLARPRSIIFYPADKRAAAARLSAELGIDMQLRSDMKQITLLLGRDSAALPMLKARAG